MTTPRAHTRTHHLTALASAVSRQKRHRDAMIQAARELAATKSEGSTGADATHSAST